MINGNSHNNILLNILTLGGDEIIAILLYETFLVHEKLWFHSGARSSLLIIGLIYLIFVLNGGVILYKRNTKNFQIPLLVLRNVATFGLVAAILLVITGCLRLRWMDYGWFLLILWLCSSVFRLAIRFSIKAWRKKDKHINKVVLVGSTSNNRALYRELVSVPYFGYKVLGYFDYKPNEKFDPECEYLGTPEQVISFLLEHKNIHELYCCLPSRNAATILEIVHFCQNNLVRFYSVPNVRNYLHNRMYFNMIGDVPYLSFYREPLTIPFNKAIKRLFDIVFSLAFICTLFPIILIIVAIITKITMPGPIFFCQKRNGLNDKEFYCIKFRSMKVNAEADTLQATKDDPRKTKWGDIMRKTNIDELPQFLNVLIGQMSVVGPRPHMLKHTEEYSKLIDKYMVRHFIKPGITGWSQVTGFRGETKELSQMEGRVKGDIWYIEHWSFGLDLYIIYKTLANAIKGDKEAY